METYRMEVSENAEADELLVDVYNGDELVEVAERVPYAEYALTSTNGGSAESHEARSTEATADVTTLDVQITRVEGAFEVRLLGDREELVSERVTDADWGLTDTEHTAE